MGKGAPVAAHAAIAEIIVQIHLAAVGAVGVAVAKTCVASGDPALAGGARGIRVGEDASAAAGAAIPGIGVRVRAVARICLRGEIRGRKRP